MLQSLTSLMLSSSTLVALVEDRVVWKQMATTPLFPRVVLHVISSNVDYNMSGPSGLVNTRIQVDCLGSTYASAQTVAAAVLALLSGYRGTYGTTKFDGIFHDNSRDTLEDDDIPESIFGVSLDFTIWHKEN